MNWPHTSQIMRIDRIFECPTHFYMVLEEMKGGELFDFLVKEKAVPEETCKYIMRQIFVALNTMHSRKLLHRDVKPENVMFRNPRNGKNAMQIWGGLEAETPEMRHEAWKIWVREYEVCLVDFDTCKMLDVDNERYQERVNGRRRLVGTYGYLAPEILRGGEYAATSDLWSVGIILYVLMTGHPPVPMEKMKNAKASLEALNKLEDEGVNFDAPPLNQFPKARDLCKQLLSFDFRKRIQSASDALQHPWLLEAGLESRVTPSGNAPIDNKSEQLEVTMAPLAAEKLTNDCNKNCIHGQTKLDNCGQANLAVGGFQASSAGCESSGDGTGSAPNCNEESAVSNLSSLTDGGRQCPRLVPFGRSRHDAPCADTPTFTPDNTFHDATNSPQPDAWNANTHPLFVSNGIEKQPDNQQVPPYRIDCFESYQNISHCPQMTPQTARHGVDSYDTPPWPSTLAGLHRARGQLPTGFAMHISLPIAGSRKSLF